MYNKGTCKAVVLLIKPIGFFLTFLLPSMSLDLEVPSKGPTTVNALSLRVLHVATCMPLPSTALYEFFIQTPTI